MAPLSAHDIAGFGKINRVGIFGCTLPSPASPEPLLAKSLSLADDLKVIFQLVDADRIANSKHLLFAAYHALRASHHGTQRAKTLGMEILRFASAQRQITRALDVVGITDSTIRIGGVLLGGSRSTLRRAYTRFLQETGAMDTPKVLDITSSTKAKAIQRFFDIDSIELDAISPSDRPADRFATIAKIVYERCALLFIEK